jgi:hypothetical protein
MKKQEVKFETAEMKLLSSIAGYIRKDKPDHNGNIAFYEWKADDFRKKF